MKKILIASLLVPLSTFAKFSVDRIDPPHWWTGMNDSSLQLQVYGTDVRDASFSVDYPGVRVDSVARLDGSSNWQHVYLTVSPETKPGTMTLVWRDGRQTVKREYQLKRRETRGAAGFDASDVLYMIMPDRFADGNPGNNLVKTMRHPIGADRTDLNVRHGGDLKGISDHIDYIDSLGVTAVWLNPVLENDMPDGSYHGYATTDYYRIDPRLGTNEEYSSLIDTLHSRGIKTVMDMIFNHSGIGHPWVEDRPSSDWFNFADKYEQTNYRLSTITDPYATDYDRRLTQDGWFVPNMPDLNQNNPHLMKYLTQNSIWWIEEAGIDGIRMDTYPYADHHRMKEWVDAVLAEYPDFNIVGECWFGTTAGEAYWQKGSPLARGGLVDTGLPVVMDFPFMILNRDMGPFNEQTDPWNGLNKIYDHLANDYVYADPLAVLRFLDNHDTERFILQAPDSLDRWKQAIALLYTMPGIPQLYYGTELLMAGDRRPGDGNVRRDIPGGFPGDTTDNFSRAGRSRLQNEAYDFISLLGNWRKNAKAVASPNMKHFMPTNGLYVYQRGEGDDRFIVVMNGTDAPIEADMSRYLEIVLPGETFRDAITGRDVTLIDDSMTHKFPPREILILQPKK